MRSLEKCVPYRSCIKNGSYANVNRCIYFKMIPKNNKINYIY